MTEKSEELLVANQPHEHRLILRTNLLLAPHQRLQSVYAVPQFYGS